MCFKIEVLLLKSILIKKYSLYLIDHVIFSQGVSFCLKANCTFHQPIAVHCWTD